MYAKDAKPRFVEENPFVSVIRCRTVSIGVRSLKLDCFYMTVFILQIYTGHV
jgi:hypothetical protein